MARRFGIGQDYSNSSQSMSRVFLTGFAYGFLRLAPLFLIIALPLLLVGFAQEVYPNIPYNIGGGQPSIAELQIGNNNAAAIKMPDVGLSSTAVPMTTNPVAIWYQSDKFLYISPVTADNQSRVRLIAVDISLIRTIRYLPRSVRVARGGQILGVHSDR
jgi:hypothetical protein